MDNKKIHIIGGGTISRIAPHLCLCAPAYGGTARRLESLCKEILPKLDTELHLTNMAGGKHLETYEDIVNLAANIFYDNDTKIVFMPAAIVDYGIPVEEDGLLKNRFSTENNPTLDLHFEALPKIIKKFRQGHGVMTRKDIFLVGFKQTFNLSEDEQYIAGLNLCKKSSANLVLADDDVTRLNMIITPEEARYCVTRSEEHTSELQSH